MPASSEPESRLTRIGGQIARTGRALWWGELGNLVGTIAALAAHSRAFIIGATITAIFAIIGTRNRR